MNFITCLSFFVIIIVAVQGINLEAEIFDFILKDYDKRSRPVEDYHSPLIVNFSVSFIQLLQVDEKHQAITTNIWRTMKWYDKSLKWNPENYGNISFMIFSRGQIWTPDILLYNTASYEQQVLSYTQNVVSYDGQVLDLLPMIVKSACKMDVTWFPFDEQKCLLVFGSWTMSTRYLRMDISENSIKMDQELVDNGEWKLIGVTVEEHNKFYSCNTCNNDSFMSIAYTIHLKRRSFYYFFNLLVPCGLIGFLAVLGFTLPPESGEKLPLGVTILFSLIVFLNTIGETMPANSDAVPLLGTYFNCVMFMIALSVVSTIVINLKLKAVYIKEVNGRSKYIFLCLLPWILRMTPPPEIKSRQNEIQSSRNKIGHESMDLKRFGHINSMVNLRISSEKILMQQWIFVATVVDRLCFIMALIITFISVTVFLIYAF